MTPRKGSTSRARRAPWLAPRSPWLFTEPNTPNVVPGPAPIPVVEPVLAETDVKIPRPDLGWGAYTLVREGDPIPCGLIDWPREPIGGPGSGTA